MALDHLRTFHGQRLKLFEKEVEDWKAEHAEAMMCLEFESTLSLGINIYDALVQADEMIRAEVLAGTKPFDADYDQCIEDLFRWWLRPCAQVEERIQAFTMRGFAVELAGEFRKRHDEARWALLPAKDAFQNNKMVELRDAAIDAMRRGDVVDLLG